MDRRQFLIGAGRLGLGVGAAALVARCLPPPAPIVAVPEVGRSPVPRDSATPSPGPSPRPPGPRDTSIVAENLRRGDRGWDLQSAGFGSAPAMFVGAASVAAGDTLDLHLAGSRPVRVEWYRLGWYGGLGGRLVRIDPNVPAARGRRPSIDPASGRAEARFPVAASLTVPDEWPSGVYFVVARPTSGAPAGTPFIVRPASGARTAPILFVSAAATWQAYNAWGGADLYTSSMADTPDEVSGRRAVQVSFDRPYLLRHGAGLMPRWELPFVRWQERSGRDVDYCTDVDLELHPEIASGRRLLVFAGHHEYWSRPMRSTLEAAIASGTNVVFLSANEMYWQVRFEPSPLGPARRMTCWKSATADPIVATQPLLTTCRWREPPVSDPEAVVIGQMYGHIVRRSADWIVLGAGHWLYEGTNLRDGDRITRLVGQEYDTFFPRFAPPGTQLLARSPVDAVTRREPPGGTPAAPNVQTATIYTADSGATVFAAGTMQWSWALDGYGDRTFRGVLTPQDARVARMTRNLFDRLGDGPLAA